MAYPLLLKNSFMQKISHIKDNILSQINSKIGSVIKVKNILIRVNVAYYFLEY